MSVLIINTTDKTYSKSDFSKQDVTVINSLELELKFCTGCFGCWVKTPGKCVQEDNMPIILEAIMNSDIVVYVSDVKVGFISSNLKIIHDKTLPLIHPYMDILHGEVHHKPRYDKYPKIALVLIEESKITDEVFDIIENCYIRLSHNMRTELAFVIKDTETLGGLNNEINNY